MINIIASSIAYTDKGFVRIFSEVNEKNRMFSVVVEDSSLGLSAQELNKLFVCDLKIE
jgi:signal transduction histidine kinase